MAIAIGEFAIMLQLVYHLYDIELLREVGKETKESTNLLMRSVHLNVHESQNITWLFFFHQVTIRED
jgi:hypothetical protein